MGMAPEAGSLLDRIVTRRRVRTFSAAVLTVNAALYALVVGRGRFPYDAQGTIILPDFMAHLTGGALVAAGHARQLYDVEAQSAFQVGIRQERHELVDEPSGRAGRQDGFAAGHGANRGEELRGRGVLEQEATGAGAQGFVHIRVKIKGG